MDEDIDYIKLPVEEKCVHKSWKARVHGYEEAAKLFHRIDDEKSAEWNKYLGLIKKFVGDSNVSAQEKGLEASLVYIENAFVAGKTVGEIMPIIVTKCIGSAKVKTKDLALQICLMYIEIEKQDIVLDELFKGTEHKNPKIAAACVSAITQALREFGSKVINIELLLRRLPTLLEDRDKNVRDESKNLAVELFKWFGSVIKTPLSSLKPTQIHELDVEFEKVKNEKPVVQRYLRSQQAKQTKVAENAFYNDVCSNSSPTTFRLILMTDVAHDVELQQICQLFNVPVSVSVKDDFQTEKSDNVLCIYVKKSFDEIETNGPNYRILGRTALLELAKRREETNYLCSMFLALTKPLYCHALSGQVICFTGFKERDELLYLKLLINHMGGKVRKDTNTETTHLIAKECKGDKYFYATLFGLPVVSEKWIYESWKKKNDVDFNAANDDFVSKYKLKVFYKTQICFLGFPEDEKNHMIETLKENDGESKDLCDPNCTHLVVDESFNPFHILSIIPNSDHFSNVASLNNDAANCRTPIKKIKLSSDNKESIIPEKCVVEMRRSRKISRGETTNVSSDSKLNRILKENNSNVVNECVTDSKKCTESKIEETKFRNRIRRFVNDTYADSDAQEDLSPIVRRLPSRTRSANRFNVNSNESVIFNDDIPTNNFNPYFRSTFTPVFERVTNLHGDESTDSDTVVDQTKISAAPPLKSNKTFVVTRDWFWSSIENEQRQKEKEFKFENSSEQVINNVTPNSLNSINRKRKRFKDRSFGSNLSPGQLAQKRRSSTSDVTRLSEGSFLDYTGSPHIVDDTESPTQEKSKNTKRYYRFKELLQTETNYVGILKTILTLYKSDLEKKLDTKDQLLNATEINFIFGNLPLICETHCRMLEELNYMHDYWNDESNIGNLIAKYSDDFEKLYPPFINLIENVKVMLNKYDETKPRFHAFLKLRQSRPECGRQSLQDLLIRPVQRLGSIKNLLNDIRKSTNKQSSDYEALDRAHAKIKQAMTHIDESKGKTESQFALFDIFNDIENCPADLLSSQRKLISRCEVTEITDNLSGRGNPSILFLFTDVIEVCKKRTKAFNKENGNSLGSKHGNTKSYKHVKKLQIREILQVMDIKESENFHKVFALMTKCDEEIEEVYTFKVTDKSMEKTKFVKMLCTQIAIALCGTDPESYLTHLEPHQLDIVSSEMSPGTFRKGFNRFATKTKMKVGRALSFSKTPNKIRRAVSAVSTMMSPFGNPGGLTPSTQLANLQLAVLPAIASKLYERNSLKL